MPQNYPFHPLKWNLSQYYGPVGLRVVIIIFSRFGKEDT